MTLHPAYEVAARELPVTTRDAAPDAVAIVAGAGWVDEAARSSAEAVVVAGDPDAPSAGLRRLLASGSPRIVLERERLRPDLVADALAGRAARPLRLVVAECAVDGGELRSVLRDALGWARAFAGTLTPASVRADAGAVSALLVGAQGEVPVVVRATVSARERPFLRITAVGETTTEVTLDELAGRRVVVTLTSEARTQAPTRWESVERLALRRALAGAEGTDLADLLLDTELADAVLAGPTAPATP